MIIRLATRFKNIFNYRKVMISIIIALLIGYFWPTKSGWSFKSRKKYILLWTNNTFYPLNYFMSGEKAFIRYNCPVNNCYVTINRSYFGGSLKNFDSILINGRNLMELDTPTLPKKRYPHQKYVYVNTESSDNNPVCDEIYDNYFNWTATYKLNSDAPFLYMLVENKKGNMIGPSRSMQWVKQMKDVNEAFSKELQSKKKAAAWFVSNSNDRSKRTQFVKDLQKALDKFNLKIDIYGGLGTLKCGRNKHPECLFMVKRDYFFYMALENSFAEDYVTEKARDALQYDVVPIVYGGSDYSRFLPPGSYIDGRAQSPEKLAVLMSNVINSTSLYQKFFKWKSHYTYIDPTAARGVCKLCEMLNNEEMFGKKSTYKNFRSWWHPDYKKRCGISHS